MLNWRLRAGCLGALPAGKRRAITGRRSAGWSDEASGSLKLDMAQGGWEWRVGGGIHLSCQCSTARRPLYGLSVCYTQVFSRSGEWC